MKNVAVRFRSSQQKSFAQLLGPEDLSQTPVGMGEPTYDPNTCAAKHELHLFVQTLGKATPNRLKSCRPNDQRS